MINRNTDNNWTIGNYETNRWREVDDYIQVEIFGDGEYHIGQIDKDFLNKFTERTWGVDKHEDRFYMRSNKIKKNPIRPYFHQLVIPGVDMVDHRNGNGLDNRKKNLRDGSGRVNANNQSLFITNKSGTTGVSFDETKKRWRASWRENGKYKIINFSIKKYGSDEAAKQKAIEHRKDMNEINGCSNGARRRAEPHIQSAVSVGLV